MTKPRDPATPEREPGRMSQGKPAAAKRERSRTGEQGQDRPGSGFTSGDTR